MSDVTFIGIDLGKHSFHLHGQDKAGRMVFRKKLTRSQMFTLLSNFPFCTAVMGACAGAVASTCSLRDGRKRDDVNGSTAWQRT